MALPTFNNTLYPDKKAEIKKKQKIDKHIYQ